MEQAVGIASMVKSDHLQMSKIADAIQQDLGIKVEIGGAEAEAAILGALTTPGTSATTGHFGFRCRVDRRFYY